MLRLPWEAGFSFLEGIQAGTRVGRLVSLGARQRVAVGGCGAGAGRAVSGSGPMLVSVRPWRVRLSGAF